MVCLEFLNDLLNIDSSTREGANKALEFCVQYLTSKQLQHEILENNGHKMLLSQIGDKGKAIVLNGHLDVVSAKKSQYSPVIRNGRLYGRGTADMKAAVAAMVGAMVEFNNRKPPCQVELHLVTDEETGGENCSKFLADKDPNKDFVICGEPTNLHIGTTCKGILQIDIMVNGKSAHGSRPWEGENAILKTYELFNRIKSLPFAHESSGIFRSPSINLSKIEGGMVYNKVPDCCVLSLDIRFLPEQNGEDIIAQINRVAGNSISIKGYADPVITNQEDEFVQLLARSVEKYTGARAKIVGRHGSTDARFYSKYGIPAVEFGPCGAHWHGDDEYVVLDSIHTYEKMLIDFIENILTEKGTL